MANNSNRVFVSPGVYTSEKDLSFVSQSVGVTTLGLAGETLRGPAFEPIFISSYGDFTTYFGGVSAEKYTDSQIPKYELSYIAKSYLQQSNQLFVTRVLGYSGYDAGPSWSIVTVGDLDCATLEHVCNFPGLSGRSTCCGGATGATESCDVSVTAYINITGSTTHYMGRGGDSVFAVFSGYSWVAQHLDRPIELYNGSSTTLRTDLKLMYSQLTSYLSVCDHPSLDETGAPTSLPSSSLSGTSSGNPLSGTGIAYSYGCHQWTSLDSGCSGSTVSTAQTLNYPIHLTPSSTFIPYSAASRTSNSNALGLYNRLGSDCDYRCNDKNDSWTYNFFDYNDTTQRYVGRSVLATVGSYEGGQSHIATDLSTSAETCLYSAVTSISTCQLTGKTFCDYHDVVVATFRSRGLSTLSSGGPEYEITGTTHVEFVCSGSTWQQVLNDPFSSFGMRTRNKDAEVRWFDVSMNETSKNYIKRVFGVGNFDRNRRQVPIFVEESYPKMLTYFWKQGYIRGLRCDLLDLPSFRAANNTDTIAFYQEKWQTPVTPYIVSELRGFKVFQLFRFITIPDGNAANRAVKFSIINISFERKEFDIIVRDFNDTDANPIILEKYTRCSLNPTLNTYVGKKIGTSDGQYELNSRYVMLEINPDVEVDDTLWDALPCGFEGYQFRKYDSRRGPTVIYKAKYDSPGEVIFDPPFGVATGNNQIISAGDKVRKVYLGISDTRGIDPDFFEYKGKQAPTDKCADGTGEDWPCLTQGFHMDKDATCAYTQGELCKIINCGTECFVGSSGTTDQFVVGDATFRAEPTLNTDPYYRLNSRKFTVLPYGGFDGWDIYRKTRSNSDAYRRGQSGYLAGACITTEYPNATGDGSFKPIGTLDASTDYYPYLDAIQTFANPEAVNINVFATPGIDYVNNSNLVEESIEMVEDDRADSLYVTTTPDYNMFVATPSDIDSIISPVEAVDNLENVGIDSNYTATYYPWVLNNDTENNVRIYLPPTYEVMRNIALTDNISFPWFASAGYTRGIVNAVKARKKLTLDERDTLYQGRINPIATYSDVGTVIWGNKTLQVAQSALDRINVRRLLLQARKLISAVAVRLLFEQNDEQVRNEFLDLVNPILDSIRRERGLTDFRVVLSDDPQLIDQNTLEGKIYIKPTRSLEFISVEFLITPTGASFENV